jgi:phosphatidylserine/phosphatidylglycerophosphate/cardiolipin synthase-like enzyme
MELTTYHAGTWAEDMAYDISIAQHSIFMTALSMLIPAHVPQDGIGALYRAMQDAAQRGVKVEVRLAAPAHFAPASQSNLTATRRLAADGIHIRLVGGAQLLHAKTCIVDSETVWIGSGNFTQQAATSNHEAYLRTVNKSIAERIIDRWRALP